MSSEALVVRRATVDDLAQLRTLWSLAQFAALEQEKRLTEFQVVLDAQGQFLGAVGLHIAGKSGHIHHVCFTQAVLSDRLLPLIWDRLKTIANNHALTRLWTQAGHPFWKQSGFGESTPEQKGKLPAAFGDPQAPWSSLQLRDELAPALSLDNEFELFQQAERDSTAKLFQQAKVVKVIATIVASLVFLLVIFAILSIFSGMPKTGEVQGQPDPRHGRSSGPKGR